MHKTPPLNKHIPYYIDKFSDAREQDIEFRRFFDRQMIYRLYPYLLDKQYSREACRIAKKFDYSQLKWSLHFRMFFPKTYYFLHKIRTKLSTQ